MSWLRKRSGRAYFSGGIVGNYGIRYFLLVGAWARRLPVSSTKYSHLRLFAAIHTIFIVFITVLLVIITILTVIITASNVFYSVFNVILSLPTVI
jgi:hypothetical protein